jgi:hypothetical protein
MTSRKRSGRFHRWFFEGMSNSAELAGPHAAQVHHRHRWWQVMCLTGVDYFSTLGYQPGIAFLAAGALSPVATFILVLLTLFGALPVYGRVAEESPRGQGSVAMLQRLFSHWTSKGLVLVLLGFAATDFIITMTLSSADAAAHVVENPLVPPWLHSRMAITCFLLLALAAVFLRGFKEAIGIAVGIVAVYLVANVVVIGRGLLELCAHPEAFAGWKERLLAGPSHGDPWLVIGLSLLVFPKLALGLSGFETGVTLMPLVEGGKADPPDRPAGRIRNTRMLLATAALVMSVLLVGSSLVTTLLIPPAAFQEGGEASGRALAYLAHAFFGSGFGTAYDIATLLILWFAGASAMAGLLNLVPRYLPDYGMAPEWAKATRPLVVVFAAVALFVTWLFDADVEAQGGAYATGVLVLMTSAAIAVTLSAWRRGWKRWPFLAIALVFVYTAVANMIERPEGLKIALCFIAALVVVSIVSRAKRSTELRITGVVLDKVAACFVDEAAERGGPHFVANEPDYLKSPAERGGPLRSAAAEYQEKIEATRLVHRLPADFELLVLEVYIDDASEFTDVLEVCGTEEGGYRSLRCHAQAVPNAIAAFLIHVGERTGRIPAVYFEWAEGNPLAHALRFVLFGAGDAAPVTREILRQAIREPAKRPRIYVG